MKLTLTTDRKLIKIEGADFSLTLNGKTNAEYGKILSALGVEIIWIGPEDAPAQPELKNEERKS